MIQIYERHMVGGIEHEHIANVKWINQEASPKKYGESTRAEMVEWLDKSDDNLAYVEDRTVTGKRAYVGTIHPSGRPAYIRTYADKKWTNNLLSLPEY